MLRNTLRNTWMNRSLLRMTGKSPLVKCKIYISEMAKTAPAVERDPVPFPASPVRLSGTTDDPKTITDLCKEPQTH